MLAKSKRSDSKLPSPHLYERNLNMVFKKNTKTNKQNQNKFLPGQ